MDLSLQSVPRPQFHPATHVPEIPSEEYERRITTLFKASKSDWVIVYADREHYGNLVFLLNFDPRFEEALLVLGSGNRRILIVGNEGLGYLSVLPIPVDVVLSQSLSLSGQSRDTAPRLVDVLKSIGIKPRDSISMVGWKYLEEIESAKYLKPAFVPAFLTEILQDLIGESGKLVDGTSLLMHPESGIRAYNTADQIAAFEAAARDCSYSVFNIIYNAKPGMSEIDAVRFMDYNGKPMSMHPIFVSGSSDLNGLRSPGYRTMKYGDAVSTAIGYWGSLVCRAGILTDQIDESFFDSVVTPYFRAIVTWYQNLRIGIQGDDMVRKIEQVFSCSGLHSLLNPGHLTSYDEWLNTPFRPKSKERMKSGMVFQCDIIPTPMKPGESLNCEDTVALADASLRAQLKASYPDLWLRIQRRRHHVIEYLCIDLNEEILPLTDSMAHLPPFWLIPDTVCVIKK